MSDLDPSSASDIDAQVVALVDNLIGDDPATPFGLYVLTGRDPAVELARQVETEVFTEFFGNSRALLDEQYGPYEDSTLFLLVIDHHRRTPAGMIRLQFPSDAGLKSFHDIERVWGVPLPVVFERMDYHRPFETTFDGTTVAVRKEYRRDANELVWFILFAGVNWVAASFGMETMVGLFDVAVLSNLEERMAEPFKYLDRSRPEVAALFDGSGEFTMKSFHRFDGLEPRRYLDSPLTVPVWVAFAEQRATIAQVDPALHSLLFEGCRGMEDVVSFPPGERLAEVRPAA